MNRSEISNLVKVYKDRIRVRRNVYKKVRMVIDNFQKEQQRAVVDVNQY